METSSYSTFQCSAATSMSLLSTRSVLYISCRACPVSLLGREVLGHWENHCCNLFDTWMLHTKNFHSSCSLVLQTLAIFSVLMMASWRKCCSIGSCTYKNFFSCNYTQDLVNGYSCSCEVGWSGQRCEVNIDDCDPNQCQNEATCTVSCSYAIIPRISVLGM